jgi:hypothetical protein
MRDMEGPQIVAHTLSRPGTPDRHGNLWQYHSRSDRHSKVACWAILFDMMQHSPVLRRHVETGRVVLGVNKEMRDFHTNRAKNLDIVIAAPGGQRESRPVTLADLAVRWSVRLSEDQQRKLASLPPLVDGPTGVVRVALEAKACMTAHIKALPRLYDELDSSQTTIHANTGTAIAVGFAMVNASPTFISPDLNKHDLAVNPPVISEHRQPLWATRTVAKLEELPRRTERGGRDGFDALGIVVVDMANDGTAVHVVHAPPAPTPKSVFHYDQMLGRLIESYEDAFSRLS